MCRRWLKFFKRWKLTQRSGQCAESYRLWNTWLLMGCPHQNPPLKARRAMWEKAKQKKVARSRGGGWGLQGNSACRTQWTDAHTNLQELWDHTQDLTEAHIRWGPSTEEAKETQGPTPSSYLQLIPIGRGKSVFSNAVWLARATMTQGRPRVQEELVNTERAPCVLILWAFNFTLAFLGLFVVLLCLFFWEGVRTWDWVGRKVRRTWKEFGERKNMIKMYFKKKFLNKKFFKEL